MQFYTSVHTRGNFMYVRGYDENKRRIHKRFEYTPTLYVPSNKKETRFKNLKGKNLEPITFENMKEARDFIKTYKDVDGFDIYGMTRFEYAWIQENFSGEIHYDVSTIRVVGVDIEVDSDGATIEDLLNKAHKEITAITLRFKDKKVVFGYKDFLCNDKNVKYFKCPDERYLITKFLEIWGAIDPDCVTGWNIEFFDIPYIVKRIINVCDIEEARKLSPWRILRERNVNMRGKDYQVYEPVGVSVLDYQQLYRKFTYTEQESYSLDYISSVELGEKKLDYSEYEGLMDLYHKNPQKFYEYNIKDVDLVFRLEDKMRLIELIFAIAYDAKVNFEDGFGAVLLWDVIIYNYLMNQNIVIPHSTGKKDFQPIVGAFVKAPIIGMHDWVVSFDLTSLYPHLIMQYNISPETFVVKPREVPSVDEMLAGRNPVIPQYNTLAVAGNGCLYRRDFKGFLPSLMELQFKQRNDYKKKMLEAKKKHEDHPTVETEKEIARYNNAQMAKKIQLNSAYGALCNQFFRWYDADNAQAVTMSGQLVIQWIARDVNAYINKILKTKDVDYIIASDTDSIYVNMGPIVAKACKGKTTEEIVNYIDEAAKKAFEPVMAKSFDKLAEFTNAYANKMHMKREAIADKAIWKAKKMYILNVYDNEGVRYKEPTLKIMGIEAVKSSTPSSCRENIKKCMKLVMTTDQTTVQKFIADFREQFKTLPFDEIAFPRRVNGLTKYANADKGIPIHAYAAMTYNRMLIEKKLDKYQRIYDGDKIKFAYLKLPNPAQSHVIGAINMLPKQFGLEEYIDYDTQFEKGFLEPIRSILDVIGWTPEHQNTLEDFFG